MWNSGKAKAGQVKIVIVNFTAVMFESIANLLIISGISLVCITNAIKIGIYTLERHYHEDGRKGVEAREMKPVKNSLKFLFHKI